MKSNSSLSQALLKQMMELWNLVYPRNIAYSSVLELEKYLGGLESCSHYLVHDEDGFLKAWYFEFHRNDDLWFALLIHPQHQRKGLGKTLVQQAQTRHSAMHAWVIDHNTSLKIDGSTYISPLDFYLNLGFRIADSRLENEHISAVQITWSK